MNKLLSIDSLIIEVTRRCNASCEHCLRGNPQDLIIPYDYIVSIFSKINCINTLAISGGEPSLVPEVIESIINALKVNNVDVEHFYIVTNGKEVTKEFLQSIFNFYLYCSDNEFSGLALSTDQWHEGICSYENKKQLQVFGFYCEHGPTCVKGLIAEGRGVNWGSNRTTKPDSFEIEENDNEYKISEGDIYLNCKGNLISGCDWSYESQDDYNDELDILICHVNDFSIDKMKQYIKRREKNKC